MSSYYGKASKKDEKDLKEYQEAKTEQAVGQVDTKALQEELEGKPDKDGIKKGGRGISFVIFINADEYYRKRALKEDYAELKTKYGWLYDQPIKADVP